MNKINAYNAIVEIAKINSILNKFLISVVDRNVEEDELKFYRRAIGNVMGEMCDHILNPIFKEYPDLIPNELKKVEIPP